MPGRIAMAVAQLDRRMLAVLAADVVGYSRLMEADEPGTIARLKAVRAEVADPLIASHHGRLVKLMGDGALVVFESVVDAVTCAAAIQRAVTERNAGLPEAERVVFRMGVNLGDVALVDGDVDGDGVNVAARLEQMCDPGGVVVSGTAYDQLHGKLDLPLDFAGERQLKNIARPIRVYRVAGAEGVFGRDKAVPPATKPTIAVLPFDNMSGDPEQGYFSDGVTGDIITELSRFRSLFVIARNSSFVFKGRPTQGAGHRP
jgi:adenylate cyclase